MTYRYPQARLLVFCKAPVAGQVKTRLMPEMSAQQAVEVHCLLTRQLLSRLNAAQLCPVQLWCSPNSEHPFFQKCADDYELSLHNQKGRELGERMRHAIATSLVEASSVLLVGCDSASLTIFDLSDSIERLLLGDQVVIAPAEDGGYVMIGCNDDYPTLFVDMEWGTDHVFYDTLQRAEQAELSLSRIRMQWDIDTIADWQRFCDLE